MSDHDDNSEENGIVAEESSNTVFKHRKSKKRNSDEDLLEILKKKYCQQEIIQNSEYENEDKLFLLSLCKDLQSTSDYLKLNVKSQILSAIASAKQVAYVTSSVHHFPSTT